MTAAARARISRLRFGVRRCSGALEFTSTFTTFVISWIDKLIHFVFCGAQSKAAQQRRTPKWRPPRLGCRACQAEAISIRTKGGDNFSNHFVERHAELLGAANDVVAIDGTGERFVFHLLFYRGNIDIADAF